MSHTGKHHCSSLSWCEVPWQLRAGPGLTPPRLALGPTSKRERNVLSLSRSLYVCAPPMMAAWGWALAAAQLWLGINKRSQALQAAWQMTGSQPASPRCLHKDGVQRKGIFKILPPLLPSFHCFESFQLGENGSPSNIGDPLLRLCLSKSLNLSIVSGPTQRLFLQPFIQPQMCTNTG